MIYIKRRWKQYATVSPTLQNVRAYVSSILSFTSYPLSAVKFHYPQITGKSRDEAVGLAKAELPKTDPCHAY